MILIATIKHQHIYHLLTRARVRVEYLEIRSQPPVDTRTHAHTHIHRSSVPQDIEEYTFEKVRIVHEYIYCTFTVH
jgi:hypothetical protein